MDHFLSTFVLRFGYLAIFITMAAESAGIPIPSEVVMPLGGALANAAFVASLGANGQHLNLVLVALAGVAANLAGSLIAYWVARTGGRPLMRRWSASRLLGHGKLERTEAWFDRYGDKAVLVSRIVPVVRTFISFPAGLAEMPVARFMLFTVIGSLPWNFALAAIGLALGSAWQNVGSALKPVSLAIAVLAVVGIAWWLLRRSKRQA